MNQNHINCKVIKVSQKYIQTGIENLEKITLGKKYKMH